MGRSEGLLDLREGDALRQRDALPDVLRLADQDIQISMIDLPRSFRRDGD